MRFTCDDRAVKPDIIKVSTDCEKPSSCQDCCTLLAILCICIDKLLTTQTENYS